MAVQNPVAYTSLPSGCIFPYFFLGLNVSFTRTHRTISCSGGSYSEPHTGIRPSRRYGRRYQRAKQGQENEHTVHVYPPFFVPFSILQSFLLVSFHLSKYVRLSPFLFCPANRWKRTKFQQLRSGRRISKVALGRLTLSCGENNFCKVKNLRLAFTLPIAISHRNTNSVGGLP